MLLMLIRKKLMFLDKVNLNLRDERKSNSLYKTQSIMQDLYNSPPLKVHSPKRKIKTKHKTLFE